MASVDAITGAVILRENTSNLEPDDPATPSIDEGMVLLYNNVANFDAGGGGRPPQWELAQVTLVEENAAPTARITLNYGAYDAQYSLPQDGGRSSSARAVLMESSRADA